ncbi:hypothetical protein RhiirA1_483661 [Rhizophagus irregularis]|uniref:Uncharacterized protein n=1 Tax=Rhizophagus irregularis TaxID=588596 RepID=A0A2I1FNE2_9GLOM|nr:hypothetical protein RhiirA1_483661 [Rhizophagus irregularis]PKY35871.1 hypothetical protein RhiirB3_457408 [Rhizophagus irregularis]
MFVVVCGCSDVCGRGRGALDSWARGRRLEDRNRLDTVLVLAVNDADWTGLCVLSMRNLEYAGSGDSMLARVKLEEIDGRTPQGVECAA